VNVHPIGIPIPILSSCVDPPSAVIVYVCPIVNPVIVNEPHEISREASSTAAIPPVVTSVFVVSS